MVAVYNSGFPTTLDTVEGLGIPGPLAGQHGQVLKAMAEAIEALEAKVGINSSAVTTAHDYKLSELESMLFYQDTQLTAAQVKALAAANITLVTAPAAGLAAVPVMVHFFLDHGGSNDFVQTNATDQLALKYAGGSEIIEIGTEAQITALIEASADAALYVPIAAGTIPEAAAAIQLDNNGAAEYSGNAANDNTLSVRVYYRVVPMAAFS